VVCKEETGLLKITTIDDDSTVLAEYFSSLNESFLPPLQEDNLPSPPAPRVDGEEAIVVTFSHYLPRQELCPEKKYLLEPNMTKVIGSQFLEAQIRRVKPQLHIFGHTHIPIELTLEGTRYVQWPLGYAREKDTSTSDVYG
jgi:hypothetical protein